MGPSHRAQPHSTPRLASPEKMHTDHLHSKSEPISSPMMYAKRTTAPKHQQARDEGHLNSRGGKQAVVQPPATCERSVGHLLLRRSHPPKTVPEEQVVAMRATGNTVISQNLSPLSKKCPKQAACFLSSKPFPRSVLKPLSYWLAPCPAPAAYRLLKCENRTSLSRKRELLLRPTLGSAA